ncbi:MAG: hypothetical protein QOC80_902 [Frankiaceae bacterium]|jgi:pimeloyl-ACP methyl ester carboxylesterase|nr:hypothetical protein [Frankiaceae bacterium]
MTSSHDIKPQNGTARSADGTPIAYTSRGSGPPLILVDGAFGYRGFGPMEKIAAELVQHHTVVTYDRRGRGDSGSVSQPPVSQPHSAALEFDDLQAVIDAVGGAAGVFGYSSGASLALQAAPRLRGLTALAVYESPYIVDDSRAPYPPDYLARTDELIAAGKLGAAIGYFMVTGIGLPRIVPALMRLNPQWRTMKRVAVTLGQDARLVYPYGQGRPLPADSLKGISVPTWVGWGTKSPDWIQAANQQIARLLVDSDVTTAVLDKQTHLVKPRILAPELIAHFGDTPANARRA